MGWLVIEATAGDRVHLINEGSVFTDSGSLVREGESGVVIGFRGINDLVIHWLGMGAYGTAPRGSVAIERR